MDRSTMCIILFGVLMYLSVQRSHSELIVFPRDTEIVVNHSTYFNCSTSMRSEQIHWYHYRVGDNRTNYVYYKGQFNKIYSDRYSIKINIETGEYNLIIRSVQPGDGGRYACQDDGGLGSLSSAELIVLEEELFCQSNVNSGGLVGPNSCGLPVDDLQLLCGVSYVGNIPPIMQWKMVGDDAPIYKGISIENDGKRATMSLVAKADIRISDSVFICRTTRSSLEYHNCTTGPIQINYALEEPLTVVKRVEDTVTCSANASVPCKYRWLQGNDSICPVSCIEVLTTIVPGEYSCEALCTIKDKQCTFVASRISVHMDEASDLQLSDSSSTAKTVIIAVLVPILTILLTLLIALAIRYLKMQQAKAKSDKLCEELKKTMRMEEGRQSTIMQNSNIKIIQMNDVKTSEAQKPAEAQPLLLHENKIADNDDEEKLQNRTNVTETRGKPIAGIAILDNLLYVVFGKVSAIETYDVETLCYKNYFKLNQLSNPWDLASCKKNKCLYIMDMKIQEKVAKTIFRVDAGDKSTSKWSTRDDFGTLSVTPDGNVILTVREKNRFNIYKPDGKCISVVQLNEDLIHPLHTIQLSNGHFMISHGFGDDSLHRICIIDEKQVFGPTSFVPMENPTFMVATEKGFVFIADSDNGEVFTLNSDLEQHRMIVTRSHGLRCPQRICLDEGKGRLFVADNEFGEFNRRNGKLLAVDLKDLAT